MRAVHSLVLRSASFLGAIAFAAACGGRVLEVEPAGGAGQNGTDDGSSHDSGVANDPGAADSGGTATQAEVVFVPAPEPGLVCNLAGMNANDLWCAAPGDVRHWNGHSWTRVPVPGPAAKGFDGPFTLAPAGPNELWYSASTGLAHLRVSGTSEDLTAALGAPATGGALHPYLARAAGRVYLLWPIAGGAANAVYVFDGARFQPEGSSNPAAPATAYPLASGDAALWGIGGGSVVRDLDSAWTSAIAPVDGANTTVTGADFWAVSEKPVSFGKYNCIGACNEAGSALGDGTGKNPWRLVTASSGAPTLAATESSVPVPTDLRKAGTHYDGRTILPGKSGTVALVACVTGQVYVEAGPGTVRHVVVNEWNGVTLGPTRHLPPSVPCPSAYGHPRPLDDGTWVFSIDGTIALVRP